MIQGLHSYDWLRPTSQCKVSGPFTEWPLLFGLYIWRGYLPRNDDLGGSRNRQPRGIFLNNLYWRAANLSRQIIFVDLSLLTEKMPGP